MAEPTAVEPVEMLRALQRASLAEGVGDNSLVRFQGDSDSVLKAHLTSQGYDLKNNTMDAALRVWQVRHGLHGDGLATNGKPDLVTQMVLSREMAGNKEDLASTHSAALDDLTRLANGTGVPANGNKDGSTHGLEKVFVRAGYGPAPAAVRPTEAFDAAAGSGAPAATEPAPTDPAELERAAAAAIRARADEIRQAANRAGHAAGQALDAAKEAASDVAGNVRSGLEGGLGKLREWGSQLGGNGAPAAQDPAPSAPTPAAPAQRGNARTTNFN